MEAISVRSAVSIGKHDQISDLVFFLYGCRQKAGKPPVAYEWKICFCPNILNFFFADFREFMNLCEIGCTCFNCKFYDLNLWFSDF